MRRGPSLKCFTVVPTSVPSKLKIPMGDKSMRLSHFVKHGNRTLKVYASSTYFPQLSHSITPQRLPPPREFLTANGSALRGFLRGLLRLGQYVHRGPRLHATTGHDIASDNRRGLNRASCPAPLTTHERPQLRHNECHCLCVPWRSVSASSDAHTALRGSREQRSV